MAVDDPLKAGGDPATAASDAATAASEATAIAVTTRADDDRPRRGLGRQLASDLGRAAGAALVSSATLAVVELVATLASAHHLPPAGSVLRFAGLDLTLAALLAPLLFLLYAALAVGVRLALAAVVPDRARRFAGVFTPDRPPDRAAGWLLGLAVGAATYVAGTTLVSLAIGASFKERTLAALLAALAGLAVVTVAVALASLVAGLTARLAPVVHPRLGRLSPVGSRGAAFVLLAAVLLVGLAVLVRVVPQLRPLLPWRHLLAALAIVAGAELYATAIGPRRLLWPRPRRRRWIVAGSLAAGALLLVPLGLWRLGADAGTKALWLSASPTLTALVDGVRLANDFDHDGFGSLLGENDCAPFDRLRHPLARDLPDNDIDENCDGRDFKLGRRPSYARGQRLPVPDAYRGPWNFLLVTVDTVRYDHTTMGGYAERRQRNTTPNLAALAARSVSFDFAVAPSPGTMASVPAILTSRFFHSGIALGEERKGKPPVLKPQNLLVSEVMKQAGYTTGAILSHEYFNDWGMEQGFDTYDNSIGEKPDAFRVTSDRLTDRALSWIGEHADRRWFLWVHYIDPHGRYVAHPGDTSYGTSEEDLYDGELAFTDKHLGRLLAELERLPGGDRTVIIVTSDHGDGFNEHGFINHAQALYFELLHVPLVVYVPNIEPRVVPGPVSPLDILPTLADLVGVDVTARGLEGESLVPQLFHGRDARERVVFSETNYPKPQRSVVAAGHKLIYKLKDNVYELYDLARDPHEQKNLWPSGAPAAFDRLKGYLDDWLERVYYARDPEANQAMAKLKDVLLDAPPTPDFPVTGSFDDGAIQLLGLDVSPRQARAGDKVDVSVYLRAARRPSGSFLLQLEGRPSPAPATLPRTVTSLLRPAAGGALPTERWRDGEIIRDRFQLRLPPGWGGPGEHRLVLGLRMSTSQRKPMKPEGERVAGAPELLRLGEIALVPGAAPPPPLAPTKAPPLAPTKTKVPTKAPAGRATTDNPPRPRPTVGGARPPP
jgi:choline-sulfatase